VRAAIYNPYLDTLGGGERYTLAVATTLINGGYQVDVEWKEKEIKEKLEKRFGLNLEGINFIEDIKRGDGYDVCFWVSDGSIPTLRSRNNFLHFQVPFHDVNGNTLLNKMKLFRIKKIICNSLFTKRIIDKEYGVDSIVIYPPVAVEDIKSKRKEKIILSVGRFSQLLQSKRQDVLIKAFKKMNLPDWKLIIAGGTDVGEKDFVKKLKKESSGFPIEVMENPDFKIIKELYGKAKIFWSASGFGTKEEKEPEKVEHFGITVVEAMAAETVPVVFNAGGHKEIVQDRKNGFLWTKTGELIKKTQEIINDFKLYKRLSRKGKENTTAYSYERFEKQIIELL
jgi:glycosyltransferase involved in cell wall biosynthesis